MNLDPSTAGEIYLEDNKIDYKHFKKDFRKNIQIVFQDPDASLNTRWKIVNIIGEPLKILEGIKKEVKSEHEY